MAIKCSNEKVVFEIAELYNKKRFKECSVKKEKH